MGKRHKIELIIKSFQGYSQVEMNRSELFVIGTLRKVGDRWIICYENENNGLTQIVLFNRKTVVIKADGVINYYLRISEGRETKATFRSRGLFSYMSVKNSKIESELTEKGKKIELSYDLEIDFETVLKNKLIIFVRSLRN